MATMIFIFAFPTLVSAMSGYDANVAAHIRDQKGNFISFQSFSRLLYIVHDGWRINREANYLVLDGLMGSSSGIPIAQTWSYLPQ